MDATVPPDVTALIQLLYEVYHPTQHTSRAVELLLEWEKKPDVEMALNWIVVRAVHHLSSPVPYPPPFQAFSDVQAVFVYAWNGWIQSTMNKWLGRSHPLSQLAKKDDITDAVFQTVYTFQRQWREEVQRTWEVVMDIVTCALMSQAHLEPLLRARVVQVVETLQRLHTIHLELETKFRFDRYLLASSDREDLKSHLRSRPIEIINKTFVDVLQSSPSALDSLFWLSCLYEWMRTTYPIHKDRRGYSTPQSMTHTCQDFYFHICRQWIYCRGNLFEESTPLQWEWTLLLLQIWMHMLDVLSPVQGRTETITLDDDFEWKRPVRTTIYAFTGIDTYQPSGSVSIPTPARPISLVDVVEEIEAIERLLRLVYAHGRWEEPVMRRAWYVLLSYAQIFFHLYGVSSTSYSTSSRMVSPCGDISCPRTKPTWLSSTGAHCYCSWLLLVWMRWNDAFPDVWHCPLPPGPSAWSARHPEPMAFATPLQDAVAVSIESVVLCPSAWLLSTLDRFQQIEEKGRSAGRTWTMCHDAHDTTDNSTLYIGFLGSFIGRVKHLGVQLSNNELELEVCYDWMHILHRWIELLKRAYSLSSLNSTAHRDIWMVTLEDILMRCSTLVSMNRGDEGASLYQYNDVPLSAEDHQWCQLYPGIDACIRLCQASQHYIAVFYNLIQCVHGTRWLQRVGEALAEDSSVLLKTRIADEDISQEWMRHSLSQHLLDDSSWVYEVWAFHVVHRTGRQRRIWEAATDVAAPIAPPLRPDQCGGGPGSVSYPVPHNHPAVLFVEAWREKWTLVQTSSLGALKLQSYNLYLLYCTWRRFDRSSDGLEWTCVVLQLLHELIRAHVSVYEQTHVWSYPVFMHAHLFHRFLCLPMSLSTTQVSSWQKWGGSCMDYDHSSWIKTVDDLLHMEKSHSMENDSLLLMGVRTGVEAGTWKSAPSPGVLVAHTYLAFERTLASILDLVTIQSSICPEWHLSGPLFKVLIRPTERKTSTANIFASLLHRIPYRVNAALFSLGLDENWWVTLTTHESPSWSGIWATFLQTWLTHISLQRSRLRSETAKRNAKSDPSLTVVQLDEKMAAASLDGATAPEGAVAALRKEWITFFDRQRQHWEVRVYAVSSSLPHIPQILHEWEKQMSATYLHELQENGYSESPRALDLQMSTVLIWWLHLMSRHASALYKDSQDNAQWTPTLARRWAHWSMQWQSLALWDWDSTPLGALLVEWFPSALGEFMQTMGRSAVTHEPEWHQLILHLMMAWLSGLVIEEGAEEGQPFFAFSSTSIGSPFEHSLPSSIARISCSILAPMWDAFMNALFALLLRDSPSSTNHIQFWTFLLYYTQSIATPPPWSPLWAKIACNPRQRASLERWIPRNAIVSKASKCLLQDLEDVDATTFFLWCDLAQAPLEENAVLLRLVTNGSPEVLLPLLLDRCERSFQPGPWHTEWCAEHSYGLSGNAIAGLIYTIVYSIVASDDRERRHVSIAEWWRATVSPNDRQTWLLASPFLDQMNAHPLPRPSASALFLQSWIYAHWDLWVSFLLSDICTDFLFRSPSVTLAARQREQGELNDCRKQSLVFHFSVLAWLTYWDATLVSLSLAAKWNAHAPHMAVNARGLRPLLWHWADRLCQGQRSEMKMLVHFHNSTANLVDKNWEDWDKIKQFFWQGSINQLTDQ